MTAMADAAGTIHLQTAEGGAPAPRDERRAEGMAANRGIVTLLRLEGAVALAAGGVAFAMLGGSWWLFAALFLAPDLSMLGYLRGPRVGAAAYNAGHTYAAPALLAAAGLAAPVLLPVAAIWVAHIGFDRMMGYGLKLPAGFNHTHLGRIGKG